ncbi:MAG TPA: hypothetical protein DCL16_07680 [Acidimicrobiaceae bacterium]|nr:hypothetical protein [Acidimicrobiaceae bacterium]|tara:strand:+ start:426 stop:1238 length:813 start_codon:yes stop_codon:yes gene_type:complete
MWQSALVHPIERLRYVARAGGFDQIDLAREAADALASLWGEPAELVNACRRILHHHPLAGSLWVMATRLLVATDARRAALDFLDELNADSTSDNVTDALPAEATVAVIGWPDLALEKIHRRRDLTVRVIDAYGEGAGLARSLLQKGVDVEEVPFTGLGQACTQSDVVIVEATASGPDAFIAPSGSYAAAVCGVQSGKQVWVVVGHGRALPQPIFEVIEKQLIAKNTMEADDEVVPIDVVTHVVGPQGVKTSESEAREDCVVAAELLRPVL